MTLPLPDLLAEARAALDRVEAGTCVDTRLLRQRVVNTVDPLLSGVAVKQAVLNMLGAEPWSQPTTVAVDVVMWRGLLDGAQAQGERHLGQAVGYGDDEDWLCRTCGLDVVDLPCPDRLAATTLVTVARDWAQRHGGAA